MKHFVLEGRKCILSEQGNPKYTILFPVMSSELEAQSNSIVQFFEESMSYRLIAFEIRDWDMELTPWEMDMDARHFGKGAKETLAFVDRLTEYDKAASYCLMGYSLAGVFALYGCMNRQNICGAISASGSLWYRDFETYLSNHITGDKKIYLSLGEKEEKTGHKVMCSIGVKTQKVYEACKAAGCRTIFVTNPGGHFTEPAKRLYMGMKWILENRESTDLKDNQ